LENLKDPNTRGSTIKLGAGSKPPTRGSEMNRGTSGAFLKVKTPTSKVIPTKDFGMILIDRKFS
jgi:hypothetical protein